VSKPRQNPPLRALHSDSTLSPVKLTKVDELSTEMLIQSLAPDQPHSLKARPDGTILDGHHRVFILRKRGVDVDSLPREIIEKEV
jgi:hypothetical protein